MTAPLNTGSAGSGFAGPEGHADVAVLVVTFNSAEFLPTLISDIRQAARAHVLRLVIVDNGSVDDTLNIIGRHDDVIAVESGANIGYAGGINFGLKFLGSYENLLILNPDLTLREGTVSAMLEATRDHGIGAVVPLILDSDGKVSLSLHREPSLLGAFGDALFGRRFTGRSPKLSDVELRLADYNRAHDVDWATGAALMVPWSVVQSIGKWSEDFFLYSEEVDYFRRIRESGLRIRFDPSAVLEHRGAGSGSWREHAALKAVNRVLYVEQHHGPVYSALFRVVVVLSEVARSYEASHRHNAAILLQRSRWSALPKAEQPRLPVGGRRRGSVVIPACNEADIIERTLRPLSRAAADGTIELVVVCNGCTDATAAIAGSVPGVQVVVIPEASKTAAINAGDAVASLWPRLYLDADVRITERATLAVLDRLGEGDVLAASPRGLYECAGASRMVKAYFRARDRLTVSDVVVWRAGAYALSKQGHERIGSFPPVTNDDMYVDSQFALVEKAIVETEPAVRQAPRQLKDLVAIKRRHVRGNRELQVRSDRDRGKRSVDKAARILKMICGPISAFDALVYTFVSISSRIGGRSDEWERDESTRKNQLRAKNDG